MWDRIKSLFIIYKYYINLRANIKSSRVDGIDNCFVVNQSDQGAKLA